MKVCTNESSSVCFVYVQMERTVNSLVAEMNSRLTIIAQLLPIPIRRSSNESKESGIESKTKLNSR